MADVPRVVFPSLSPLEECTPDTLPCTHPDFRRGVWLASMSKEEAEETHRVTAEVFDTVQRLLKQKPEQPPSTITSTDSSSSSSFTFLQEPSDDYHHHHHNSSLSKHVYPSEHNYHYWYTYDSYSGCWGHHPCRTTGSPPSTSPATPFEDEAFVSFHPQSMPAAAQQRGWLPHHEDDDLQYHNVTFSDCYYTCPESGEGSCCDEQSDSAWPTTKDACELGSTNALGLVF